MTYLVQWQVKRSYCKNNANRNTKDHSRPSFTSRVSIHGNHRIMNPDRFFSRNSYSPNGSCNFSCCIPTDLPTLTDNKRREFFCFFFHKGGKSMQHCRSCMSRNSCHTICSLLSDAEDGLSFIRPACTDFSDNFSRIGIVNWKD